jgi:hypothetical protein
MMSEPNTDPPPRDEDRAAEPGADLQFDQAEYATPVGDRPICAVCKQPIADVYYELGGKVFCARCRQGVEAALRGGSPTARVLKSLVFGTAAAAVGAVIYYAIIRARNINIALVSILVGFMVGAAVRMGSGSRGGPFYQALAIVLTYASIVAMYVLWAFDVDFPKAREFLLSRGVGRLLFSPVTTALKRPISGLIYAFALWEAWKINRGLTLVFHGPFRLSTVGPGAAAHEVIDDGG